MTKKLPASLRLFRRHFGKSGRGRFRRARFTQQKLSMLDVHVDIAWRVVVSLNATDGAQTTLRLPIRRAREMQRKLARVLKEDCAPHIDRARRKRIGADK